MAHVLRSTAAQRDAASIWRYIAEDNPTAADRFIDAIDDQLELLARTPGIGRVREEFAPLLRSFPLGHYLIFYRPIKGGIEVLRIMHGAREIHRDHFK